MISLGGSVGSLWDPSGTVEVTDLGSKNNTDCRIANLPEALYGHSAIYTKIGLLVCGGIQSSRYSNKCYILGNGSWAPFPDFTQPRQFFSLTALNEKIVMIGGINARRSIEYFNIQNGSRWENKTLEFYVAYHCAVAINETSIMIIGGYQDGKVFRTFD